MTWKIINTFDQFEAIDLYRVLKLRQDVFIIEQDCIYEDIDLIDLASEHILLYDQESLVGYCRIVPEGEKFDTPSIGRVIVNPAYRGSGKGKLLMERALGLLRERSVPKVIIEAQEYLERFYESLGFIKKSKAYEVDGIDHILMEIRFGR
jgi:ElaA protein